MKFFWRCPACACTVAYWAVMRRINETLVPEAGVFTGVPKMRTPQCKPTLVRVDFEHDFMGHQYPNIPVLL